MNNPTGAVSYMILAAEKGDITTIIGGIAPNWGPFGSLGNEARVMIEVAEQGKGLIVAGLTGVFIIGSLGTLFTIVYGMAV